MAVALTTMIDGLRRMGIGLQREPAAARLPVAPALCVAPRVLRVGALATLADCAGGMAAMYDADLGMHATTDITVHATGRPCGADAAVGHARVLRRRRDGVVVEVDVVEDRPAGERLAIATATFVEVTGGGPLPDLPPLAGAWPPHDLYASLEEVATVRPGPGGNLEVDIEERTRNFTESLNGGIGALLVELEAARVAGAGSGTPVQVVDLVLQYLAPGLVGPVRARGTVVAERPGTTTVRVELVDAGAGDRPTLVATAMVRPLDVAQVAGAGPSDWYDR